MSMFMTDAELEEMTGLQRPSAQIRWMDRYGIKYVVSAEGRPRVLRSHLERMMDGGKSAGKRPQPNFEALKQLNG
jgi:hypothetical protein